MAESFSGVVTIAATPGGTPVFRLDPANRTLVVTDTNGRTSVSLDARFGLLDLGGNGNEGDLRVMDSSGRFVFRFDANAAVLDIGAQGNEGDVRVYNTDGEVTIRLDGNAGDIQLRGADVAEDFGSAGGIDAGAVVVAVAADEVALATTPCDRRVVGVVSGSGGWRPGVRLGARPGRGRVPVAMMGRVACRVDAAYGPVAFGDLLTTSATPGHAMRVTDLSRAAGAIIGKALGDLEAGTGLVPVALALG